VVPLRQTQHFYRVGPDQNAAWWHLYRSHRKPPLLNNQTQAPCGVWKWMTVQWRTQRSNVSRPPSKECTTFSSPESDNDESLQIHYFWAIVEVYFLPLFSVRVIKPYLMNWTLIPVSIPVMHLWDILAFIKISWIRQNGPATHGEFWSDYKSHVPLRMWL
jgi:hypothetical protein